MICARFFSRTGVETRACVAALVTAFCSSRPSMLSCVPSRSLSEYGIAVKFATGASAGWYFFQACVISSIVACTSSPLPKPPMLTPPPALRFAVEVSNCCGGALQLFDGVAHEATGAQSILDRVERRLHARGLLLQFADGANRGVVVHQATGEVPGGRENADQERQGQNTHRHPHGASALHA